MLIEIAFKETTLALVQGDITIEKVEAIVNAANSGLMGGGGVDGAIHRAGGPAIVEECKAIVASQGRLQTGQAVITTGGNLWARYVIHTVGPVGRGGGYDEAGKLSSCYRESLKIGSDRKLTSIAFPAISTGVYGYPAELAAKVAVHTVVEFLKNNSTSLKSIHFVVFDKYMHEIYASVMAGISL
jgi:O-acetyl-ADP-ribose deacetylase